MESVQVLSLVIGFVFGALVTGVAVFVGMSRKAKQAQQRLDQLEHARAQGAQQLTQARKQIEQLQRDCHELRLAVRPAPRPASAPEPAVDPAEAARRHAEALLRPPAPPAGPRAFKDTEVLQRDAE